MYDLYWTFFFFFYLSISNNTVFTFYIKILNRFWTSLGSKEMSIQFKVSQNSQVSGFNSDIKYRYKIFKIGDDNEDISTEGRR